MSDEITRLAAYAQAVADATGDPRARMAARILAGKTRLGRREIDDGEALEYVHGLLASGLVGSSINKACKRAATLYAKPASIDSTRRRLLRKIGQNIM